jgi:antitoxin (DNA-binding transcriptional repressor) of toxin-antitoxin stability system
MLEMGMRSRFFPVGQPVAKIVSIRNAALYKNEMKRQLLARIKNQAETGSRNWTRKELYDDDTCE